MSAWFTRLVPLVLIATVPVLFAAQNSAPRETVLNHVSVIDMTGRPVQHDMAVLIRGDRIAAIERAAGFNIRRDPVGAGDREAAHCVSRFAGSRAGSPRPIGVRVIASTEISLSGLCCELGGA